MHLRQDEQAATKTVRTTWPVLLPKRQVASSGWRSPATPTNTPEPEHHSDGRYEIMLRKSALRPSLFGFHEVTGSNLDMDSRRVFQYATTSLWPKMGQIICDNHDSVASAVTRLALSHPLTMDMFIWSSAGELEMHGTNPLTQKVLLKHQTHGIQAIRDGIRTNKISDELVHAVYALVVTDTPPGVFKSKEELVKGPDASPYGDFDPPLTSLGYLLRFSQMHFSGRHADVAAKLLASRGGLRNMAISEFASGMQAVDLVRNSRNASEPTFDLCKPYRRILETQMPLYRSGNFHSYPVSPEFNTLLLDLRTLLRQIDLSITCASPIVSPETIIAWRNINQHRLLSLPDDQDQLFRLATLIFGYNVTFPVPFRNLVEKWTRELVPCLQEASDTSEDALWATVIAAMTRPDEDVMDCLCYEGRRFIKALGIKSWYELKIVLVRYLWLDGSCDVGGLKFWGSISSFEDEFYGIWL